MESCYREGVVSMSLRLTIASVILLLAGCRESELESSMGPLHLNPSIVNFGSVYVGSMGAAQLTVMNDGASTQPLVWNVPGAPFQMIDMPSEVFTGSAPITVLAMPTHPGEFSAILSFDSNGVHHESELTGIATPAPACVPSSDCVESTFDPASGNCVETSLPDGITCGGTSVCLTGGACQAGRCVGTPKSCDDSNACTVDVCNPTTGCEHLPAPPCPGDGSCMNGVCDPLSGCGFAPAVDGTTCGPVQTCDAAQVCIAGACVMRDPPDGYICAEASPCQGEGRCVGSLCERGAAVPLMSSWDYDSYYPQYDGGTVEQLHDFVVEASGAVTLSGFFQAPAHLRANTPAATEAQEGVSRRCELWNDRLICADYPAEVNGKVSAIDLATGATVWTFDLRTARPDFVAVTDQIFMARMAVQGSDRFAALFEAYPLSNNPAQTINCRSYFLTVLDASGNLVSTQQLHDPVLDICNHPHPYGFVADSVGDLFISFSQTIGQPAPLIPGIDTTVMSFTRDGIFRWKFNDPNLVGGELAVATGLLYPENSATAILAATGQAQYTLTSPFGRLVVTQERSVPAPNIGTSTLSGYEAGTPTLRWSTLMRPGETFWSDQIRLAQWQVHSGVRTVALTFTQINDDKFLKAIDTHDGSEGFTCPIVLNGRTAPQLVEVTSGALALMEGSDACGKCDPPFADSSAAFHTYPVPLISPAFEPWIGTFGGPGHDHREEVLQLPAAGLPGQ